MWVLPVSALLAMEGPPPHHQDLLKAGLLAQWREGLPVTFVSHQWLARHHPDPEGLQLRVLRAFITNLAAGHITLGSDVEALVAFGPQFSTTCARAITSGYVWLDWFSIPQLCGSCCESEETRQAQLSAIESIPGYVSRASCFVVLCPSLHHATGELCDYNSWKARGWCRAEQMCHLISNTDARVVLVKSPKMACYSTIGVQALNSPIGLGRFTVDSDRVFLGKVVEAVFEARLQQPAHTEEDLQSFRLLRCLRSHLMAGLSRPDGGPDVQAASPIAADDPEVFLQSLGFRSWLDDGIGGFGPLECAAAAGRVSMIRAALSAGVSPHRVLSRTVKMAFLPQGTSTLNIAVLWGGPDAVQALLEARSDANYMTQVRVHPLACAATRPEEVERGLSIVRTLIEFRADPCVNAVSLCPMPMHSACFHGSIEIVQFLLQQRASAEVCGGPGAPPLHMVALGCGDTRLARLLLEHRASVNARNQPSLSAMAFMCSAARAACWLGQGTIGARAVAAMPGSTALHNAAFVGDISLTRFLMEAMGDANLRNARGHTPLDLALENGHDELYSVLKTPPLELLAQQVEKDDRSSV